LQKSARPNASKYRNANRKVWRIGLMGYNSQPENVDRLLNLFESELPAFRPAGAPAAVAV
jgi:alanine-glyoxylate transaminase/serine-glyoxylate transaminase/serine-pyruvate transaminase